MGIIKKTYHAAAALALLNLLALAGGTWYFFTTGKLDAERVRGAAAVLRGDADVAGEETGEELTEATSPDAERIVRTDASPEQRRVEDEIAWRNAERYRTQIEQRLKLINTARLDVDRRREEFEKLKSLEREEREAQTQREAVAGYAKQVSVISALKPKAALGQLMTMSDADVARIFFELSTRKVKKIVEAAKSGTENAKITTVMNLLSDMKSANNIGEKPAA